MLSTLNLHAIPLTTATQRGRRQAHFYQSNIHGLKCLQSVNSKGIAAACKPVAGDP